jgi:hypothetical protein
MPRIKYQKPEVHKPSTKEVLYSLESEYQWLELLKDKPYSVLFEIIKSEATKDEDDRTPSPSIKQIAEKVNQKPATVTKWLNQIYSDIWELNDIKPNLFIGEGIKCNMHFQDSNTKQATIFTMWTPIHFNKNDAFNWDFTKGVLGTYYFYVSEVSHERSRGEITTTVFLKTGLPNDYREHLLSKAVFLRLIRYSDMFDLPSYKMDDILRNEVENNRSYTPDDNSRKRYGRRFD